MTIDYNALDSFGMREVRNLPPHFFTIKIPVTDLELIETKTLVGMEKAARYAAHQSFNRSEITRFRDFIEEKTSGRYYVNLVHATATGVGIGYPAAGTSGPASYLLIGFEDQSDITLFGLYLKYKNRT